MIWPVWESPSDSAYSGHALKVDTQAKRDTLVHIQRGIRRLYVTLLIPWVAWFGYAAYESNHTIKSSIFERDLFFSYLAQIDHVDADPTHDVRRHDIMERNGALLAFMRSDWDVRTNDELEKTINSSIEESRDRLANDVYALLAGVTPFLLYPIALWVIAGFCRRAHLT
jgi:hypothetical protein